jgi:sugar phosphate isomerase/epimerase
MNKFSLGIFLNIFTNDRTELQEKIDFVKSISGLNHLEVLSEVNLSSDDISWLKTQLSDYQLIFHGPFTAMSLVSGHELINQASLTIYKKFIDQAITMGAKLMTIHTGKYPLYYDSQKATEIFVKNFSELLSYVDNKLILTTENMFSGRGAQIEFPSLKELVSISQLIPDINYTIDIGHCIRNHEDFYEFIEQNQTKIHNIHLHNASLSDKKDHFGLQLLGDLDIQRFINFLDEINYQKFLTLEVLTDEDKIESVKLIQP